MALLKDKVKFLKEFSKFLNIIKDTSPTGKTFTN